MLEGDAGVVPGIAAPLEVVQGVLVCMVRRVRARLLTLLLYLTWEPREGGHLRVYPPADPAAPREIEPRPGRLVVFYSQEVEHEVLPSEGERLAVTQWIWSMTKDKNGR